MNPNGPPCQMQDRILQEMAPELKGKAEVVYLQDHRRRATSPSSSSTASARCRRSIVTDASGKEIRRATPGIQSAAQVRQLVQN